VFYFGKQISIKISIILLLLSVFLSLFLYFEICLSDSVVSIKLFTWIKINVYSFCFGLLFDSLTCVMLLIICLISFIVHCTLYLI